MIDDETFKMAIEAEAARLPAMLEALIKKYMDDFNWQITLKKTGPASFTFEVKKQPNTGKGEKWQKYL
jgi:hypothetical protein